MMNRHERRRFKQQFDSQIEAERNGAPVPPEIAAHMTKPKPPEMLYQVVVDKSEGGAALVVGPMMIQPVAEEFAKVINACVAAGKEKTWRNATVVACLPVGVH